MNILVVCYDDLYAHFDFSFIHAQARAYVALGHRVKALVMIAVGKKDWAGNRLSAPLQQLEEDGVEIIGCRYLSLSRYGEGYFNSTSSVYSVHRRLKSILGSFQPDIIHVHYITHRIIALGDFFRKKTGCPLVMTTHGDDTSIPVEQGREEELKPLCDRADAIVAVSSALADKLRICGTQTPISVILNGFNVRVLPKSLGNSGVTLLQAGCLNEQKRFHVTIRAFARICSAHPEAALTLIGEGPKRKDLEALCQELGLGESVRFTGQISNADVLKEMGRARFFVMPSVREGFGIVYLEAMACGCVTIGTEGEGIADLIVSGENGFLVPPDNPDAIVRVVEWCLDHPEEADAIAERGRRDAMGLTWEKNAKQYIALFQELLGR